MLSLLVYVCFKKLVNDGFVPRVACTSPLAGHRIDRTGKVSQTRMGFNIRFYRGMNSMKRLHGLMSAAGAVWVTSAAVMLGQVALGQAPSPPEFPPFNDVVGGQQCWKPVNIIAIQRGDSSTGIKRRKINGAKRVVCK